MVVSPADGRSVPPSEVQSFENYGLPLGQTEEEGSSRLAVVWNSVLRLLAKVRVVHKVSSERKVWDAMVLQEFYKMYKVCFSNNNRNPYKCRYIHDMKILLHSLKTGEGNSREKAACKINPGSRGGPAFRHWSTVQNQPTGRKSWWLFERKMLALTVQ